MNIQTDIEHSRCDIIFLYKNNRELKIIHDACHLTHMSTGERKGESYSISRLKKWEL